MPQAENNDLQRRAGGIFGVAVSVALPVTEPVRTLNVGSRGPDTLGRRLPCLQRRSLTGRRVVRRESSRPNHRYARRLTAPWGHRW